MQNKWENLDKALDLFEPGFKIERKQGTQECRETIEAFVVLDASFATNNTALDVKKPLL